MCWDPIGNRVLMFGGFNGTFTPITGPGDGRWPTTTWELIGDEWNQLTPASNPPGRYGTRMVWDDAANRALLYGGTTFGQTDGLNDLWEYTGGNWNELHPATVPPDEFGVSWTQDWRAAMAWDTVSKRILLLYPNTTDPGDNQLWEYASANWNHLSPTRYFDQSPAGFGGRERWFVAVGWAGDRLVAAGGEWSTGQSFNDTEEYDGTTWNHTVNYSASGDSSHFYHRSRMHMVYDGTQIFLFGGEIASVGTVGDPCANDNWVYDKTTSLWDQIFPLGSYPSARREYEMVFTGTRVVLFGGRGSGGTSLGDTWVLEPPEPPPVPPAVQGIYLHPNVIST